MDVQAGYDAVASAYTERFRDKPFDVKMLDWLAERAGRVGPICDLGCGPGQVAVYVLLDVSGQPQGDRLGDWHRPHCALGLRWAEGRALALDVVECLHHPQLPAVEVDMFEREAGELAEAQAARRGRPDQALELRMDGAGQRSDVVPREQRAFDHPLGRGAPDAYRVPRKKSVVDGGRHDRSEQAVDLRHRVVVQAARREPAVPRAHRDRADVAQVHVGEHRDDVAELALVDLTRPRAHRPLGDPANRVLSERDPAGVRVDPDTAEHVGLDRREPAPRVGLVGEGGVGRDLLAEMAVARVVAAAGQLADVAEVTGSGHLRLLVLGANSVGTCRHDGPWDPSASRSPGQEITFDLGFRVERTTGVEPASSAWEKHARSGRPWPRLGASLRFAALVFVSVGTGLLAGVARYRAGSASPKPP